MNIFMRTFNDSINSKTGAPLPPEAPRRGTPEWLIFQSMLIAALKELGHNVHQQLEHPLLFDELNDSDKSIYVHQSKRERPNGDLFWMQMHMKELFTLDVNGWGADHSLNKFIDISMVDQDMATKFCQQLSDKLHASGASKCEQPAHTDMTPDNFILVPVQIPRDYTIKHHSPITVKYFLESLQAWAIESQTHLVFKFHPHNRYDYDLHQIVREAQESSTYVHKVEGNIHELIKRSRGLFVINSGTGFEALIHGKPVATFGDCDYKFATINADIRRLEEARNQIFSFRPEFRSIAYKFIWAYWHQHAYDVTMDSTRDRLTEYLKGVL